MLVVASIFNLIYLLAGNGRNFITSTHDSYLISAESADEADSWVATIKRVLHEVSDTIEMITRVHVNERDC